MAARSNSRLLLLLLTLTALLFFCAYARPSKVLMSAYSNDIAPRRYSYSVRSRCGTLSVATETSPTYGSESLGSVPSDKSDNVVAHEFFTLPAGLRSYLRRFQGESNPEAPFSFSFYATTSLRDRSMDIIDVLVLLFGGVSCGCLAGIALYLLWSLCSTAYEHCHITGMEEEDEEEAGEDLSPKKMGYVEIPVPDSIPDPIKPAV